MHPHDRYQYRQSLATRKWRVIERTSKEPGATVLVLIDGLTEKLASDVKQALVAAYFAGADAIKTGELIV